MSKNIKVGDVVTATKDITSWLENMADAGEQGIVVGTNDDGSFQVLFREGPHPARVEVGDVVKSKSFEVKAKKLGLGMKVKLSSSSGWVKLSELSFYDDRVYVEGEDKSGQSYADEFDPNDLVGVKA